MQRGKVFSVAVGFLCSVVILLNTSQPYSPIYAQDPTPTQTAPDYAEITAENARYLQPQMTVGNGNGYLPRWSPDGKQLAVGGSKGVWLLDTTDFDQPPQRIPYSPSFVSDLAFSPDGTLLASIGASDTNGSGRLGQPYLHLWDVANASARPTLLIPGIPVKIAFSPDSKYLAYAVLWQGTERTTMIQDCIYLVYLSNEQETTTYPCQAQSDSQSVSHLIFSPDSKWLAFGSKVGDMQIINRQTGQTFATTMLTAYPSSVSSATVRFTPDSSRVIINSGTTAHMIQLPVGLQINIWHDKTTREDHPIEGGLTYSDDGKKLYEVVAAPDYKSILKIWDTDNGQLLFTVNLPAEYAVNFQNLHNHTLVLKRLGVRGDFHLPDQPTFLVIDDQTGQVKAGFDGFGNDGFSDLSADGTRLAVLRAAYTSNPGSLAIIDVATGQEQRLAPFWTDSLGLYQFHANGKFLTVSSNTGVHYWDLQKKTELYASPDVIQFALSPDAKWLAEQTYPENSVNLYEFESHRLLHAVQLSDYIQNIVFTADSNAVLVVVGHFGSVGKLSVVRIDVATGTATDATPIHTFNARWYRPIPSDDGRLLVSGVADGMVIWNIETDAITPLEVTKNRKFIRWAFNPTQTLLAGVEVEHSDETYQDEPVRVVVWDAVSGNLLQTFVTRVALNDNRGYMWPPILSFSTTGDRIYLSVEPAVQPDPWAIDILGQPTTWDIATGKQMSAYPLEARAFTSSPMQDILAVATNNMIYVFPSDLPNLYWKVAASVQSVSFSPDGKWLVGRNNDRETLTLYAVDNNQRPTPLPPQLRSCPKSINIEQVGVT